MLTKKIAVLFSGSGSNLQAILDKVHNKVFNGVKIEVALCISNKADAYGIQRAKKYGLETKIIENKNFSSREEFDEALVEEIKKQDIDLVVLAGFMRILTSVFTTQIKAINLHPSILPLFKGAHAIQESFDSDMQVGGVSVHWVSEELDGGKLIAQRAFERKSQMSLDDWANAIHSIEHEILPEAIIKILCNN
ncbi:phosphoribosylglycinamide formyltransferase [Campylobacter pinnipediorum]|uniref:Phosphoribosylglycinamide formyltransferase n=1 Tax=Campylobacter pinnipediorum subsp. pinnipediorum TaxID=1660067 RepID=A0AAX0LCY7_9BACT|nr:phosphoribosylglycinamide formyltransferase [Campylobacter pinnipediorum]AQW82122.1 phosphoribosylglycinamide formyltransferase 1 [Campylobacter pinnipediorum subsp. pinnipediorum]OPA75460.1 phosphoribosylglycinamide formyltransferase [Campylobacter pinnipediorum subsp. pinnipediorum]OPA82177.1 phosphoribosylglycinamide formyltransferase [Campylobacter pinnipediorum subsp. pinnipediorum]